MNQQKLPPGWDEVKVGKVIRHYEEQAEEEAIAEVDGDPKIVESDQEVTK